MEGLIALHLVGVILGIVLVIAWTVLPFAIIGTKPLLRELIAEVQRTNALLQQRNGAEPFTAVGHNREGGNRLLPAEPREPSL